MFYGTQIVSKGGPLQVIWLASHMERQLKRQQVDAASIPTSVDTILDQHGASGSAEGGGFQDAPLALRLSGQLLLGIVRIYVRKVTYLQQDCETTLFSMHSIAAAKQQAFAAAAGSVGGVPPGHVPAQPSRSRYGSARAPAHAAEVFEDVLDDPVGSQALASGSQPLATPLTLGQAASLTLSATMARHTSVTSEAALLGIFGEEDEMFDVPTAEGIFEHDLDELELERLRCADALESQQPLEATQPQQVAQALPEGSALQQVPASSDPDAPLTPEGRTSKDAGACFTTNQRDASLRQARQPHSAADPASAPRSGQHSDATTRDYVAQGGATSPAVPGPPPGAAGTSSQAVPDEFDIETGPSSPCRDPHILSPANGSMPRFTRARLKASQQEDSAPDTAAGVQPFVHATGTSGLSASVPSNKHRKRTRTDSPATPLKLPALGFGGGAAAPLSPHASAAARRGAKLVVDHGTDGQVATTLRSAAIRAQMMDRASLMNSRRSACRHAGHQHAGTAAIATPSLLLAGRMHPGRDGTDGGAVLSPSGAAHQLSGGSWLALRLAAGGAIALELQELYHFVVRKDGATFGAMGNQVQPPSGDVKSLQVGQAAIDILGNGAGVTHTASGLSSGTAESDPAAEQLSDQYDQVAGLDDVAMDADDTPAALAGPTHFNAASTPRPAQPTVSALSGIEFVDDGSGEVSTQNNASAEFTASTQRLLSRLQQLLRGSGRQGEDGRVVPPHEIVSTSSVTAGSNMPTAASASRLLGSGSGRLSGARLFYNLLVLQNRGYVKIQQPAPFADIQIAATTFMHAGLIAPASS